MAITVTCDDCSETHRVRDDAVGKRFPCKGCGKTIKVKAPPPVEEELDDLEDADLYADDSDDDEFDFSRKAPRRSKSSGARKKTSKPKSSKRSPVTMGQTLVPLGLACVYWGFMTTVFAMIFGFVGSLALITNPDLLVVWVMVSGVVVIGASLATMIGKLMCLTAPARMSGKTFIVIAVLIDLLSVALGIANLVSDMPPSLGAFNSLMSVTGFVCFILFLQQLGRFVRESDIVDRATGLLTLGISLVVIWGLMLTFLGLLLNGILNVQLAVFGLYLVRFGMFAVFIMGIVGIVRYAGLLSSCCYTLQGCE